jgi:hypothetical protein
MLSSAADQGGPVGAGRSAGDVGELRSYQGGSSTSLKVFVISATRAGSTSQSPSTSKGPLMPAIRRMSTMSTPCFAQTASGAASRLKRREPPEVGGMRRTAAPDYTLNLK